MEGPVSTSRDLVQLEDTVRTLSKDDGRSHAEGASSTIAREHSKIEALRRRNDKLHAEVGAPRPRPLPCSDAPD